VLYSSNFELCEVQLRKLVSPTQTPPTPVRLARKGFESGRETSWLLATALWAMPPTARHSGQLPLFYNGHHHMQFNYAYPIRDDLNNRRLQYARCMLPRTKDNPAGHSKFYSAWFYSVNKVYLTVNRTKVQYWKHTRHRGRIREITKLHDGSKETAKGTNAIKL
jgi:hypothetical protein